MDQFIELLKNFHDSRLININFSSQATTSNVIKQPGQCTCDRLYINKENQGFQSKSFTNMFISNLLNNMERSSNNYKFDPNVSKFASVLNILAGHNAYEFIRLNLPGVLPSTTTLKNYNQSISLPLRECEFRFDLLKNYLNTIDSNHVFVSEDCTSVISSISYDGTNDCFIGFSSELINGLPVTNQFKTDSYSELETWFEEFDKSTHVNAHLIEPLLTKTSSLVHSRPYIISAYGTNNKVNSIDIFRKWIHIYNECKNRKINVVGFSSDCDPRYLKSNHLKIDHNLAKSDVCPRDRQNYSSCLKITSDDVLNLLNRRNTKATFVYLYILKLIILTYVKKDTDILTRLYYGWIIVFSYRMWWSSLRIEQNLSQVEKDNQFITKAAWFSSEINIHCLTSIIILVSSGHLPVYALNTYLFSSQACEATFRSARSLNGTFSSITNFSVYEFMNKIEKISILNKIKSTEESSVTTCSIKFPIHHKNRRDESSTATNTQNLTPITITDMEKIIIKAYQKAEIIMNELQLTETLKKNGLDDCKKLSSFVFKELNERSIVDYSFVDDDDIEESSDDEADDNNDNTSQSLDTDDESNENVLDNDDLDIHHIVTSKETFQGMKIYEQIDPSKKIIIFQFSLTTNKNSFTNKQQRVY
ncbi:unnamed protein product [Rotaria magnacalcarata]